jgi:hypothetical protein
MTDCLLNDQGWEALANIRLRHLERVNEENAKLREALEEIAEPIAAMKKRAEAEGGTINYMMADNIASSPQYYKQIAKRALNRLS